MAERATAAEIDFRKPVRPRLGFAGVGGIGRNRLDAIEASGLGRVAAVYDPSADAVAEVAKCVPDVEVVDSYDQLLALDLDGILLATPGALHADQAIAALSEGRAVFCQKPLGRNAAETSAVIAVARTANRLLQVDLPYRFTTGMQRIRELIASGALGRVYAVHAEFHSAYGPDQQWFYDPGQSGGGCLLDLGIHLVDLAFWCLDFPTVNSVVGHLSNRVLVASVGTPTVEDYAAAQLVLGNGASMQLACSWGAPAGGDARIGLTFFGTEGGATFYNVNGSFYDFNSEHLLPDRSRRVLAAPPDTWGARAALAWCGQLGESAAFDPSVENLKAVADALDRIYIRVS